MRATPTGLCMSEAVPFGQRFNYHSPHPIEEILRPDYFLSVRQMLRVGDDIRVCRVVGGRVRQRLDLLVAQVHPDRIDLHQLGEVIEVPGNDAPAPAQERAPEVRYVDGDGKVKWNVGKGAFEVLVANRIVAETADKTEAYRIAQGEVPLPEPLAA